MEFLLRHLHVFFFLQNRYIWLICPPLYPYTWFLALLVRDVPIPHLHRGWPTWVCCWLSVTTESLPHWLPFRKQSDFSALTCQEFSPCLVKKNKIKSQWLEKEIRSGLMLWFYSGKWIFLSKKPSAFRSSGGMQGQKQLHLGVEQRSPWWVWFW